ncbi:thiamine-phosphate kinase [Bacillaceae bacterium W0354]
MNEFQLINQIKQPFYKQATVIKGIGDDGAIVKPPTGQHLVIATDTMVEGVHFSLNYMSYEDIGYRVLVANLSDLAAMGSEPLYYLVNITAPKSMDNERLVKIFNGAKELANQYKLDLIGGDTVEGENLVITVTVFGSVMPQLKRLRNHAQSGDIIFCTGFLGESAYGYHLLKSEQNLCKDTYFTNRHVRPKPRLDFTQATTHIDRICLNDISDGIASELYEIAIASNMDLTIDWDLIPINDNMKHLSTKQLKEMVLFSGEDFELVGTCSKEDWIKIKKDCKKRNIRVTKIGEVHSNTNPKPTVKIIVEGQLTVLEQRGYRHGIDE